MTPFHMLPLILILFLFPRIGTTGFEIGNGRKIIRNSDGGYSINVSDKLEVGFSKRFTELIAPLAEGTPRARLQINIVKENSLNSLEDLVESRKNSGWSAIKLSGFDGIKKEELLPTHLFQVEIRLFIRTGEIAVINLEGVPSPSPVTAFENIKDSIDSFQVLQK